MTPQVKQSLSAATSEKREPPRASGSTLHLGPYEASYDVALGYGFERAIETP